MVHIYTLAICIIHTRDAPKPHTRDSYIYYSPYRTISDESLGSSNPRTLMGIRFNILTINLLPFLRIGCLSMFSSADMLYWIWCSFFTWCCTRWVFLSLPALLKRSCSFQRWVRITAMFVRLICLFLKESISRSIINNVQPVSTPQTIKQWRRWSVIPEMWFPVSSSTILASDNI